MPPGCPRQCHQVPALTHRSPAWCRRPRLQKRWRTGSGSGSGVGSGAGSGWGSGVKPCPSQHASPCCPLRLSARWRRHHVVTTMTATATVWWVRVAGATGSFCGQWWPSPHSWRLHYGACARAGVGVVEVVGVGTVVVAAVAVVAPIVPWLPSSTPSCVPRWPCAVLGALRRAWRPSLLPARQGRGRRGQGQVRALERTRAQARGWGRGGSARVHGSLPPATPPKRPSQHWRVCLTRGVPHASAACARPSCA